MAAYRRVYDSRHLQADCKEPGLAAEPYGGIPDRLAVDFQLAVALCNKYQLSLIDPRDKIVL